LLVTGALTTALIAGCKPGNIEIETSYGVVTGIQDEHTAKLLGAPYAKPPVGDLRWADPQPPEP